MSLKNVVAPFSAWARAFQKPFTLPAADTFRPGADRYRGWHINDTDKCIGCGTCSDICQNGAIDMKVVDEPSKGDSGLRPLIDLGRCCWCALCVDVCPTGSLALSNNYIWVDRDPEVFRYIPGVDHKEWDQETRGWRKDPGYNLIDPDRVPMPMLMPEEERVKTWAEVVLGYTEEQARKEAARCVECGLCVAACPAHMHIPDYIAAIRDGNYEEAVNHIYDNNPLPEMCGKVCTRRCEDVCSIGVNGDPLAIRWLKRFATEQFSDMGAVLSHQQPQIGVGKSVAVIGGGPGGLTAAFYLVVRGFKVTVFEALPQVGGATFFGIPKYRFPLPSLEKQIKLMTDWGVEIKTNHKVEADEFTRMQQEYDAIYIGTGLLKPSSLRAEGEDLPGVMFAIEMLIDHHLGKEVDVGEKVVVVGGGNVAIDSARIARRLGADVTIAYRRREVDMPADDEEIEDSAAEGVELITQNIPLRVEKLPNGKLDFIWGPAEMIAEEGRRPRPKLIEGIENHLEVDRVIVAIGQKPELVWLPIDVAETISNSWGGIDCDENGMTNAPGIFAGGDLVNDTADAISAIADGLKAVDGIINYLGVNQEQEKN
jgi:glutamate synthase (NADPH/NADH) small chain